VKRKHRRLLFIGTGMVLLGVAVGLVLNAFEENLVFFYSPSEIADKVQSSQQRVRLGGLVEEGSVASAQGTMEVTFRVTDLNTSVPVVYSGILPDLFEEGQGVVCEGYYRANGVFEAQSVLAKHDENYMPPEVSDVLKDSGVWQDPEEEAP
jgi:cytochrome c-type biogenesis protein CcmE